MTLREEVERLVKEWRERADTHDSDADFAMSPRSVYIGEASRDVCRQCADELERILYGDGGR